MFLLEKLKKYRILLASQSPRRAQLLKDLHLDFEVCCVEFDESYPADLKGAQITDYIVESKANAYFSELLPNDILITADTLVWAENQVLGKPKSEKHAVELLEILSGQTHQVITSVCLKTSSWQKIFHEITQVSFKKLTSEEINFYVKKHKPYDKAGSYGIQEWIGHIGIVKIDGSYTNVVGLPTQRLFEVLNSI